MRQQIFLYLFVFSALLALYLAFTGSRNLKGIEKKLNAMELAQEALRDSLKDSRLDLLDLQYFSLANNDEALAYYDHLGLEDPSRYIADKLLETNEASGNNPLVPYEGMEGDFKINKIEILNHRWIIADFSDGKYWGELLLQYELREDLGVDFTLINHLLYTRSQ